MVESAADIEACRLHGGQQSEQNTGDDGDGERSGKHTPVEAQLLPDTQVFAGVARQAANAGKADRDACRTARERNDETLGKQLANDRAASAAEGDARRDLAGPRAFYQSRSSLGASSAGLFAWSFFRLRGFNPKSRAILNIRSVDAFLTAMIG